MTLITAIIYVDRACNATSFLPYVLYDLLLLSIHIINYLIVLIDNWLLVKTKKP